MTDALVNDANVEKKIAAALPPRASFLAAPLEDGVRSAVDRAALRLAQSSRFETLWERVNRRAHAALVKVLTGGGSRVSTENGTVAVNVEQIVENVKQRLDAKGITVLDNVQVPPDKQQLVIVQSKDLEQVQGLVDFLQKIAWFIPLIALACFAGAIGLSGNRRRTILRGALGVAFAVAVQLVLLKAGRNLYLDAVTTKKSTPGAAGAVWDQLTSFLRTSGLTTIAARAGDRLRGVGRRALVCGYERARLVAPRLRDGAGSGADAGPVAASSPAPRRCCAASASRSPSWC